MSIEIGTDTTEVVVGTIVEVESSLPETVVDVTKTTTATFEPTNFVLSSGGMYSAGTLTGNTPAWLATAMTDFISSGTGSVLDLIAGLQIAADNLAIGVAQNVTAIQTDVSALAALETSVSARLDGNTAAILAVDLAKVTDTEALAIAASLQESTFGPDAGAYIGSIASTYVDANSAVATDFQTLAVNFNGLNVGLTTTNEVVAGYYSVWDGVSTPLLGQFKFIGDVQYQFLGGTLGTANDGWVQTDASASTIAIEASGWAGGASKLVGPTDNAGNLVGPITGWEFGDGSAAASEFVIHADNFRITNSTDPGNTPFSVSGSNVSFNGLVSFSNTTGTPTSVTNTVDPVQGTNLAVATSTWYNSVLNQLWVMIDTTWTLSANDQNLSGLATSTLSNVTTIDGGKITADTLLVNRIKSRGTTAGFDMDGRTDGTQAAGGILGCNIYGGTIYGGVIEASTMLSSTMRIKDLIVLTDADYQTVAVGSITFVNTIQETCKIRCTTNLFSYNAASATGIRATTASPATTIIVASPVIVGYVGVEDTPSTLGVTWYVYRGGTLLGTASINLSTTSEAVVAGVVVKSTTGITFGGYKSCYSQIIGFSSTFNMAGEGELSLLVSPWDTTTIYSSSPDTPTFVSQCTIINI